MVDKDLLFKPRLPEADVDVPGVGTVRVRGLSRAEVLSLQRAEGRDTLTTERKMLALALVDPVLTEAEVGRWQKACAAGELEVVSNKVAALSALRDGAAKEVYKKFEADPDAEFRVLPGGETGDDGDEAAPGATE